MLTYISSVINDLHVVQYYHPPWVLGVPQTKLRYYGGGVRAHLHHCNCEKKKGLTGAKRGRREFSHLTPFNEHED